MSLLDVFRFTCGCWLVAEIVTGFRAPGRIEERRRGGSTWPLWVTVLLAIGAGLAIVKTGVGGLHRPLLCQATGLALVLLGIAIRFTAIVTLRQFFTVNVAIVPGHRIVRRGLYAHTRHPAYLGVLLGVLGIAVSMNNVLAALAVFIPAVLAFLHRIRIEEAALRAQFGAEYEAYAAATHRLVRGIY